MLILQCLLRIPQTRCENEVRFWNNDELHLFFFSFVVIYGYLLQHPHYLLKSPMKIPMKSHVFFWSSQPGPWLLFCRQTQDGSKPSLRGVWPRSSTCACVTARGWHLSCRGVIMKQFETGGMSSCFSVFLIGSINIYMDVSFQIDEHR